MGGTFDPVHYGHLVIAEEARFEFALDRVVWVPAGDPPHKTGRQIVSQEHRYAMVVLATASNPAFDVSRLELEREGPSYTVDTVAAFRELWPEGELFFITGADATLEILTWHRHQDLIAMCRFIAVTRPGYDLERLSAVLPASYLERISTIQAPGVDISSTGLRDRVEGGEPIKYLVPEGVEVYIAKHGFYGKADSRPPSPG